MKTNGVRAILDYAAGEWPEACRCTCISAGCPPGKLGRASTSRSTLPLCPHFAGVHRDELGAWASHAAVCEGCLHSLLRRAAPCCRRAPALFPPPVVALQRTTWQWRMDPGAGRRRRTRVRAWFWRSSVQGCAGRGAARAAQSAGEMQDTGRQSSSAPPLVRLPRSAPAVLVRTYRYESERVCDSRMSVCLKSIEAAHSAEGQGFAGTPSREAASEGGAGVLRFAAAEAAYCTMQPELPSVLLAFAQLHPCPAASLLGACSHQGHRPGAAHPAGAHIQRAARHS